MKKKIIIPIILLLLVTLPLTILLTNKKEYKLERINYQTESNRTPVYWTFGGCMSNCGYANAVSNNIDNLLSSNSINPDTITKIVFNNTSVTGEVVTSDVSIDVSKTQDGSVLALVVNDILYIQYDGILYLNEDSSYLFQSMIKVVKIDGLDYVDTSNVKDMSYMFDNMSSITELDLSNLDTGNVTDMSYMFTDMSLLTSLDLSNLDTGNVTYMDYMFDNVSSITELDLSSFDTSNVTSMRAMFHGMKSLIKLDVSSFNTSKVRDMYGMFGGISSIIELDLSNFNTDNVTNMGGMFKNMSSLTELDLSNFDTRNVTEMREMFSGLSSLTSLDVSNFDTNKVTDMGLMFIGVSSLINLDISSFNTSKVTDMQYMFNNMRSLTSLDLSNFDTSSVTDMGYMFHKMDSLEKIYVSEKFDTSKVTNMSNMFNLSDKLVGWNGTVYDSNYKDGEYARIDSLSNPGYFSAKVESDLYIIDDEQNYVYTGNETNVDTILSGIQSTYGDLTIEDNKLLIKYNDELVKSFDIANISSEKYDLSKGVVYVGPYDFDNTLINITNATLEETEDLLTVKYNDIVLQEYPIIKFYSDSYEVTDKYIIKRQSLGGSYFFKSNYELRYVYRNSSPFNYLIIEYNGEEIAQLIDVTYDSSVYDLFDEEKNYIYVADVSLDLNDIVVSSGIDKTIENNKLIISHEETIFKEMNILSIDFGNLIGFDKTIISKINAQYEDFISNITTNGVSYKIYDGEEEVTTGNITTGMSVKVYVDEYLVDTYEIIEEYIKISDNLSVNGSKNIIENLSIGQTVEEIISNVDTTGTVKIVDQENNEVTGAVGTGYKLVVQLIEDKVESSLSVSGDVTGDGQIQMGDVMKAASQILDNTTIVGDCYLSAADVTGDGKIKMSDVMKLANIVIEGDVL